MPTFCAGVLFWAVCGFVRGGLAGTGLGLLFSLGGFAIGFGLLLLMYFIGGSGAGDVKFMGALGSWLVPWLTFQVLIVSALLASLLTIGILSSSVFRMKGAKAKAKAGKKPQRRDATGPRPLGWRVPYGVPAAVATWCVLALELSGYGIHWSLIQQHMK